MLRRMAQEASLRAAWAAWAAHLSEPLSIEDREGGWVDETREHCWERLAMGRVDDPITSAHEDAHHLCRALDYSGISGGPLLHEAARLQNLIHGGLEE